MQLDAHSSPIRLTLIATLVLALAACGKQDAAPGPAAAAGGKPPPAEVGVVTTALTPVDLMTELPGRIEPRRTAQVRARVNGVVQERVFEEGSLVKAGQVLFRIDPAPYQAAFESAQAALAKAQANLSQAAAQAERYKPLVEANAVSKQEYIATVAAAKQAEADVAAGKAAVLTAKLNLDYATVTSPIEGRIGRALVTEGALVSAAEATQLALVQQVGTVYVNFTQPATDIQGLRRAAGRDKAGNERGLAVSVLLDDGSEYAQKGKLLFSDLTVDPTSGQVLLRAEVPNADGLLMPGQYVRVRLAQRSLPAGILLPQQAVTRNGQEDRVIVVSPEGVPGPRQVKIAAAQNNQWVVLEGLKAGEQVVVEGFQKMMPGATVKPVQWKPAPPSALAAPVAPAAGGSATAAK